MTSERPGSLLAIMLCVGLPLLTDEPGLAATTAGAGSAGVEGERVRHD